MDELRTDHVARLKSEPVSLSVLTDRIREAVGSNQAIQDGLHIAQFGDYWTHGKKLYQDALSEVVLATVASVNPSKIDPENSLHEALANLSGTLAACVHTTAREKNRTTQYMSDVAGIISELKSEENITKIADAIEAKLMNLELSMKPAKGEGIS
jgi:hypothetical protein